MNGWLQEAILISRAMSAFIAKLNNGTIPTGNIPVLGPNDPIPRWPCAISWNGLNVPITYDPPTNTISLDA